MIKSRKNLILLILMGLLLIILPQIYTLGPLSGISGYLTNASIEALRWTIFALAFDLVAGHIGSVSLGQPIFFGMGAYMTALLSKNLGLGFLGNMAVAAVAMALFAILMGVAFFRIRKVTFAIGTLGAGIVAMLIANNAFDLTGGAMCTTGIPRPVIDLPLIGFSYRIVKTIDYYYLLLPLLAVVLLSYRLLTTGRIGKAFTTVREDEIRASAVGIYPLRYKLLAFSASAALIGALGAFQAQYVTVVCPTEMAMDLTTNLLIMVFVGGAGKMRGVIIGAVIFSALPRLLEMGGSAAIQPAYQQMIYGLILVLVMLFMPDGLDGLITRISSRWHKRKEAKA